MPASSDRPETMTKAPSPDRRTPGGVVAAVTPPAHYFCGSGSAPSAHSGLRLCCLRATFTTLVPSVAMAAQQTMTADLAAVEQHTTDRHTGQRAPHVR